MEKSPFLELVRTELRTRRYSLRTEKVYLQWIKGFILFNDKKHPKDMGNHEIERFLNNLAVNRQVSAATQNQALCAVIFLYRYIINRDISDLRYSFTKREKTMPTVLTHEEATTVISHLNSTHWLIASLLYGCGLRISEALQLRIKDINLADNTLFIFRGKGRKDRYTLMPKSLNSAIEQLSNKLKKLNKHMTKICVRALASAHYPHRYSKSIVVRLKILLGNIYCLLQHDACIHTMATFAVITFMALPLENN